MKYVCLVLTLVISLSLVAQSRYSVIITELMVDPSPAISLPAYEWIEVQNTTTSAIDLRNWRITTTTTQSGALPSFLLPPSARLIICSSTASSSFLVYGDVLVAPSFPAFDNTSGIISITRPDGGVVHAVEYNYDWYSNELKKNGGWSLEMIDASQPCSNEGNFSFSTDVRGGTPGSINASSGQIDEPPTPRLQYAYAANDTNTVLVFDMPLDSGNSATISNYAISDNVQVIAAHAAPPLYNKVELKSSLLSPQKIYSITVNSAKNCAGATAQKTTIPLGLSSTVKSGDIIINEILFNPRSTGFDYVELMNIRESIIDLSQVYIANRNAANAVANITAISKLPRFIYPGEIIVVTTDAASLTLQYHVKNPIAVLALTTLPSYPDDAGTVLLLDSQGNVIDELAYTEKWQFPIIQHPEGVALERIDAKAITQLKTNWHSAASTAGYGTPTYKNSQAVTFSSEVGRITIIPKSISPNNDGNNDFATITYSLPDAGFVATVTIFNAAGILVKTIAKNALLGNTGHWVWDGLNNNNEKLLTGIYIVVTDLYHLNGTTMRYKSAVVVN